MPAGRSGGKSAAAFRTISEVSQDLDVPQHVLRFWESKFTPVRPLKRGGGRRYYRPEDVDLLRRIRNLLYTDGYTIKGVQRLLREGHGKLEPAPAAAPVADDHQALEAVLDDLVEMRDLLRKVAKR
jgi:DNA-binding transcriptional MerR regulator